MKKEGKHKEQPNSCMIQPEDFERIVLQPIIHKMSEMLTGRKVELREKEENEAEDKKYILTIDGKIVAVICFGCGMPQYIKMSIYPFEKWGKEFLLRSETDLIIIAETIIEIMGLIDIQKKIDTDEGKL